jgi:hypothetical protein
MLDRKTLQKKVILSLLSSPGTLLPLLGGSTLALMSWALSADPARAIFGGVALMLAGLGVFASRLLMGSDEVTKKAIDELQREAQEHTTRKLDALDARLQADGDSRSERCLRDLRALVNSFKEQHDWSELTNATSTFDILSGVDDLFHGCVRSLERSFELWSTAQRMNTASARQPLLKRREGIIGEVQESIIQLGRILAGIQGLGSGPTSTAELGRLRDELHNSLEVARRVDEKMKSWRQDVAEFD